MKLHLIWAQDRNGAIGSNNALPWHLPEDLRRFKEQTRGLPVIMGRRTFESLPGGALPFRLNLVVSRSAFLAADVAPATSLRDALDQAARTGLSRAYVIGGAQLYSAALAQADVIERTLVDIEASNPDTFAPAIPEPFVRASDSGWLTSKTGLRYSFETWVRS